jgi:hypothetical protein
MNTVNLFEAVKIVLLAVALLVALPAMAMAHAGHSHDIARTVSAGSSPPTHAAGTQSQKQTVMSATVPDISDCASGSCCCQGMRTCSLSGHCCNAAFSQSGSISVHWRIGRLLQPPRFTFAYPKIFFGLDRPPKA